MEKTRVKKVKTIQITYPAPYSQSFNTEAAPVLTKNIARSDKLASFLNDPKRTGKSPRSWSQSYSTVRGPDPTAPHLKYGVFPNRRVFSSRTLPKSPPVKAIHNQHSFNLHPLQSPPDLAGKKNHKYTKRRPVRNAKISESPVFVFKTLDKQFTRQLSLSEIMHVDIKPKKYSLSPSYCPSPRFLVSPTQSPR